MLVLDAPMYETEAWSQGIQLDEPEQWFQLTSLETVAVYAPSGTLVWEDTANAANRRQAEARARMIGGSWTEGDYWEIHPPVYVAGSAPLMGQQPEEDTWQGAIGGAHDVLWARELLTVPDRIEFTWEPVRDAWETERAASEARWFEARAEPDPDSIEALMMEVPA
jgi:hypothetical protein